MNESTGIARIVEVKTGIFRAEILLDNAHTPVDFFCRDTQKTVAEKLELLYPNVVVVRNSVYRCELDHINLFGCRSDDESYVINMGETNEALSC